MIEYNKKSIRLLPINPRYTSLESIKVKELKFDKYDETKVAKELIKYEGNFEDLLGLIKGISKNGFLYLNDKILIHLDTSKENYYVLEGNRRLLSVKLLTHEIDFEKVCSEKPFYSNVNYMEWMKNRTKILKIINEHQELKEKANKNLLARTNDWFLDVTNENESIIWQTIYSKHVGEQIGKRNWSRAKYFDDLLKMYKKLKTNNKNKTEIISELADLFGKKPQIIKGDIKSAIWIIESIQIYNKSSDNEPTDLNMMEVSGYELLLSKKINIVGKDATVRNLLEIKIDDEKIKMTSGLETPRLEKIIAFFVKNSLSKKITTRDINPDIYEDLEELIGYTLNKKRSLNHSYKQLSQKKRNEKLTKIEEAKYNILLNLKSGDMNIKGFEEQKHDSKFIKSIKYTIRNDLKTLSNLKLFDEDSYPFTNVANTIRNIVDLFILEMVYRIKDIDSFSARFKLGSEEIETLKIIKESYDDSAKHDVNKITGVISNIVISKGATTLMNAILNEIDREYHERLKEIGIDIQSEQFKAPILKMLDFKKPCNDKLNNFSLLNGLSHKPYYGFENSNNVNMIDNLNIMFSTVKQFTMASKIWRENS